MPSAEELFDRLEVERALAERIADLPADQRVAWLRDAKQMGFSDARLAALWDTSDAIYDSLLLLDNWIWNLSPAQPGTN